LREQETELGDLIADAFIETSQADVILIGSGSIRSLKLGPLVTLLDLNACFPYDDSLHKYQVTGKLLKKIFNHIMRNENRNREGECYQVNMGVQAVHDSKKNQLKALSIKGKVVDEKKLYSICVQAYHLKNSLKCFNVTEEELLSVSSGKVATTSAQEVLEEFLRTNQNLSRSIEGRLVYLD